MGEFRISGRWYFHRDDIRDARASDTRLYGRYMENALQWITDRGDKSPV